jgi:predicted ATP-binding protein involved in virulence
MTGANGSGKTTAILLLQAILHPNFTNLFTIPFERIEVSFIHRAAYTVVRVLNIEKEYHISASTITDSLIISRNLARDFEYLSSKKEGLNSNDTLLKEIGPHPVIEFIKQLPSPIFIGLERRNDEFSESKDIEVERRLYLNRARHEYLDYKRQFKGSLGPSLLETEFLVQAIYKRVRVIEERYAATLQDEILLSSFDYVEFEFDENFSSTYDEKRKLLSRRKEIEYALSKISHRSIDRFREKLSIFFEKLDSLLNRIAVEDNKINIEWLINKSQIDKLSKLVEIIDDYTSRVQAASRPINKFTDIINSFFKDSNKSIYVDEVGHLFVKRPNGKDVPIDALSSGERQVVILFANVMFNKNFSEPKEKENILFIDEPELSLHIRWQEIFIEKLLTASDNTQFILATHSPDIVGEYKLKSIKINQRRNNA